jgi:HlyD family secretion protein
MKKIIIIAIILASLAIGAYFVFFNNSSEDYTFRYDKVYKGDVTVVVSSTGSVNAVNTIQVGSQVSGIVSKLYADFNSIVKAGQIVAQIDSTFLEQSVRDAEAAFDRAQAQFNNSKRVYERTKSLFEKNLESQLNYDAALTDYEMSNASLKSARAQVERARINLSYANINAPVDGVVIDRKIDVGQTVAASFSAPTLFTIAMDLKKMQVQATVDESDIGKVCIGQEASFTVDAYSDQKFYGKISQIRLSPVVVQNVVNYTVVIDVPNDELKLMPGMTANVKILIAKKQDVVKVPNIALRFQPPTELIDTMKLKELRDQFRNRASSSNLGQKDSSQKQQGKPSTDQRNSSQNRDFPGKQIDQQNKQNNQRDNRQMTQNTDKKDNKQTSQNLDRKLSDRGNNPSSEGMRNPGDTRPGSFQFNPDDREKFKKIRDSIMAAHGGNLSREEIMQEMQKLFRRPTQNNMSYQKPATSIVQKNAISNFQIIQRYPQYQKNSIAPLEQSGMGRIWIMNSKGKLEPVFVRTGLNDGQSTEIFTDKLSEGQQIVIGAFSNNTSNVQSGRNPLTGQGQGSQQMFMGGGGRGR